MSLLVVAIMLLMVNRSPFAFFVNFIQIVTYGMLLALLYQLARSYGIIADNNTKRLFPKSVSYLVIFISIMTIMVSSFAYLISISCRAAERGRGGRQEGQLAPGPLLDRGPLKCLSFTFLT